MIERFAASRWSAVAAWAVAAVPLIVSVVGAIVRGEWMLGDRSIMGLYAHDVFTTHPPLVGTVSTLGLYTSGGQPEPVYHLGPAQFYALAGPDWLASGHPAGLYVGGLVVNVAAIGVVVWGCRRRLGPVGGSAAALAMVGLSYGLGAALLRDIWTPHLGLWPLLALLVATWSLVDGDVAALPWAVGLASFLAQIELLFVGPAFVLSIVGVVGLVLHRFRGRNQEGDHHADRPRLGRPVAISAAIAVVMWLPVAIQEATGHPGNLTLLIRSLGEQKARAPLSFVWGNLVALVRVPPIFLDHHSLPFEVGTSPSVASMASAAAVIGLLGWLSWEALRRRCGPPVVGAMLVTTWAALVGGAVNLAITPAEGIIGLQYRRWMWPVGAFLWLTIAVAASYPLRRLVAGYEPRWTLRRPAAVATVGLLALAAVGVVPASAHQQRPVLESPAARRSIESAWPSLLADLPPQPTYVTLVGADAAFAIGPEIIRRLVWHGWTVRVPEAFAPSFGRHRVLASDRPAAQTLQLVSDESTLAPGEVPVRVVTAGRRDGRRGAPFVRAVAPLVARLQTAAPFELTATGRRLLDARFRDRGDDPGVVDGLLAAPARAMFDRDVLDLQLHGEVASSPLSDAEARWLHGQLGHIQVVGYLLAAPPG